MPDDPSRPVRPGNRHSLHKSGLTHEPRAVLERLRALVTHDLGLEARADLEREIRSWEYHLAALERQPT